MRFFIFLFCFFWGISDYSKLPRDPPVDIVFLLDPLIATGRTACAALTMIVDWGIPGQRCLSPHTAEF
jgi:uracil phosphoribosyltransferase